MTDRTDSDSEREQPDRRDVMSRRHSDPARLLAFTDGVFAIIITILVLDIRVPSDLDGGSLRAAIDDVAPTLIAWVMSFLITGMLWVWHRDVFAGVRAVNRALVWLNLLFLVPVSLIPFAASVLGEYSQEPVALRLYGAILIGTSVGRAALFGYLSARPQLLHEPVSLRARRFGLQLTLAPIGVYAAAMSVASASPAASLVLYGSVPVLYVAAITHLRTHSRSEAEAADYS